MILIVIGTRPEIIKMSPIIRECTNQGLDFQVLHSGQHYSYAMDNIFFEQLNHSSPDYTLDVGSGTQGAQTAAILTWRWISGSVDRWISESVDRGMYPQVPVREDTISGAGLHFTLAKVTFRYQADFTRAGLSLSREIPGTVSLNSWLQARKAPQNQMLG